MELKMNSNNLPSLPINADSCFAPNCNKTLDESPMYLVPIDERTRALCFQAVGLEIDALSCAKKNIFACSNHHSYMQTKVLQACDAIARESNLGPMLTTSLIAFGSTDVSNMDNICRLCLRNGKLSNTEMIGIFGNKTVVLGGKRSLVSVAQLIETFADLKPSQTQLQKLPFPPNICRHCFRNLCVMKTFRENCRQANNTLTELFGKACASSFVRQTPAPTFTHKVYSSVQTASPSTNCPKFTDNPSTKLPLLKIKSPDKLFELTPDKLSVLAIDHFVINTFSESRPTSKSPDNLSAFAMNLLDEPPELKPTTNSADILSNVTNQQTTELSANRCEFTIVPPDKLFELTTDSVAVGNFPVLTDQTDANTSAELRAKSPDQEKRQNDELNPLEWPPNEEMSLIDEIKVEEYTEHVEVMPLEVIKFKIPYLERIKCRNGKCKRVLGNAEELKYHAKSCHDGQYVYKCVVDKCKQQYKMLRALRMHHEGKHSRKAHATAATYICKICNRQFGYSCSLKSHMESHGDPKYECEMCGKKMRTRRAILKHMLVHNDQRNHKCDVCSKAFQTQYTLRIHLRLHTKEKPFVCHMCADTFSVKCLLNAHIMKCHPNETVEKRQKLCDTIAKQKLK